MTTSQIDAEHFVDAVQPLLEQRDLQGLASLLKTSWSSHQIVPLLQSPNGDARKVAALALSLVGQRCCTPELVTALKDSDPIVSQMAEHALWCIWFRSGAADANHELARGTIAVERGDLDDAIRHFSHAIELAPTFGEAYNQRAIAYYLCERFDEALHDGMRAVELVPCHFGAWAGMGHCYAHLDRMEDALKCYRKALEIHPHLECIFETVQELRRRISRR
jgi:tetratricopeptide (TPR) repeat protein